MLKKVLLGVLLAGLIGVLVVGAANRTSVKMAQSADTYSQGNGERQAGQSNGYGQGRGTRAQDPEVAAVAPAGNVQGNGRGQGGSGNGQGSGQGGQGNGRGQGGSGNGQAASGGGPGQAQVDAWLTLQGVVVSVSADAMAVQADAGEVIVDGRSWSFAQEQGFAAQVGDAATLTGFWEDGDFEVGQIDNLTSGQSVSLRDASGRPLWAGRGRGGA